jgi:hypothetical protein
MALDGEYIAKNVNPATPPAVGEYVMLRSGYWVKLEAGGLYSGPYKTTDGVTFTLIT